MAKDWEKSPVFLKAMAILNLVQHLTKAVENTEIECNHNIEAEMITSNLEHLRKKSFHYSC